VPKRLPLAVVALVVALALHGGAGSHLWLHMTQHVLFVTVVAPLFGVVLAARRPLAHPWPVLVATTIAHSVAMWAWHLPGPFDAALHSEPLHAVEHACLLGTAVVFFWAALALSRHALPGAAIAAVFVVAIQGTALGAIMTLASHPWYEGYDLGDQQLAGVVMWCPAGFIYVGVVAAMLYAWLSEREPVAANG
jgi:cytochrome c oxidase assembly factor CtaG